MNIGIPKEILVEEKRLSLTPQGVYSLVKEGHKVYIESGAGAASFYIDSDFQRVGGEIVFSHDEVFKRSDLIVKVMPPTLAEITLMKPGLLCVSFLQLGLQKQETIENLIEKNITAIGTELIETSPGVRPLFVAIGEIAGFMMPQIAGRFLQCDSGGRGVAIGGFPGIPPTTIMILGAGNLGFNAAKSFIGQGAQVVVLDEDISRLRYLYQELNGRVITSIANPYSLERFLKIADVFIGAVYQQNKKTPIVITEEQLSLMKKGTLVIDASIDHGGCVATSRPTTHSDPVFQKAGIMHYCVPNITSVVSRTASEAINNIVLPYLLSIAREGLEETCKTIPSLASGIYVHKQKCRNKGIAEIFNVPFNENNC